MKTRPVVHTRQVPVTVNGTTHLVDEDVTVHVPVPPRDWDHIVLTTVTAVAALVLTASVAWSTSSIGGLLGRMVTDWVAYLAAAVYDLSWITCMAIEWLSRYDAKRARAPMIAGHVALGIAMAAVIAEGALTGPGWAGVTVGAVGALVSVLAKGTWTLVLRHTARPLDPAVQKWLDKERSVLGGQLALGDVRRELARAGELLSAQATLSASAPDTDTGTAPDTTVRDAVLSAPDTLPGADPEAIAAYLAQRGIRVVPDTPDAPVPDTDTRRSDAIVRDIRPDKSGPIADTIRACLRDGIRDRDTVTATVRATHGDQVPRDTVIKTLRRLDPTA
jgi:hypothetical protein